MVPFGTGFHPGSPYSCDYSVERVLAKREDEDVKVALEGRFRPAGGDFQGIWVYRPDVANCGWFSTYTTLVFHRFDEPIRLSLG